jgi:NAD(P)-dependent dehydrogenase (short-subunit alcohol dehydrogenase family)
MRRSSILILGASRGLGLGLAEAFLEQGWSVVATERGESRGLRTLAEGASGRLRIERADVTNPADLDALAGGLEPGSQQILMVNAGVGAPSVDDFPAAFQTMMAVNALGCIDAVRRLSPLVARGGVVSAMSSGLGSVAGNTSGGWEPYRSSKAALNQSLRSFAAEPAAKGWAVTAIAPGWVRTDMGGPSAPLDVAASMAGVASVLLSRQGASGAAFLDYRGQTVAW